MHITKIQKIMISLTILGILLLIWRIINYNNFLGSFLDLLWVTVFSIALYDKTNKLKYMIIPLFLGFFFEIFQYLAQKVNFVINNYYPGTPDKIDILFYILGYFVAMIIIYVINPKNKEN